MHSNVLCHVMAIQWSGSIAILHVIKSQVVVPIWQAEHIWRLHGQILQYLRVTESLD